jgi:hypothetical protein
MLSIVDQQPVARSEAALQGEPAPEFQPEAAEYEIVLGRAQIASWLFVGLTAIAVCSSLAYLAGKSALAKKAPAAASEAKPAPAASSQPNQQAAPEALPAASIVVPPKTDLQTLLRTAAKPVQSLFAEPEIGKVYIQIGAVEKGMAMILAEGLRSHGFDAFVAPGPSERIFRVLIGPLPDPDSFRQAKAAVDAIDLATFARKFEK